MQASLGISEFARRVRTIQRTADVFMAALAAETEPQVLTQAMDLVDEPLRPVLAKLARKGKSTCGAA